MSQKCRFFLLKQCVSFGCIYNAIHFCHFCFLKLFNNLFIFIPYTLVFSCMCACMRASDPHGTEIIDSCVLPRGCWDLIPGLLEEHLVLLTTEPSFQSHSTVLQVLYDRSLCIAQVGLLAILYLLPHNPSAEIRPFHQTGLMSEWDRNKI